MTSTLRKKVEIAIIFISYFRGYEKEITSRGIHERFSRGFCIYKARKYYEEIVQNKWNFRFPMVL